MNYVRCACDPIFHGAPFLCSHRGRLPREAAEADRIRSPSLALFEEIPLLNDLLISRCCHSVSAVFTSYLGIGTMRSGPLRHILEEFSLK